VAGNFLFQASLQAASTSLSLKGSFEIFTSYNSLSVIVCNSCNFLETPGTQGATAIGHRTQYFLIC